MPLLGKVSFSLPIMLQLTAATSCMWICMVLIYMLFVVLVWSMPVLPVQLSPKKALRAAILKSRFADTILKAQQKTLLDHVSLI